MENTEPFERALSAMLTPRGDRLAEIAERNGVDVDVLREVAHWYVHEHLILVESDGEPDNPRLYRNYTMDALRDVWRKFSHTTDREALEERRDDLEDEIEDYRDQTGYDSPKAVLEAREEGVDLSHVETPDTGELYWDVVSPWRDALHHRHLVEVTLDNYDFLAETAGFSDMEVEGQFGDFSDINAIEAKLGIRDQPPTDARIDEEGELHHDGDDGPVL